MFLHVGSQVVILMNSIEAIFNLRTAGLSHTTKEFLTKKEKMRAIRRVGKKNQKSFILDSKGEVILSPIETSTLRKRFERGIFSE